MKNLSLPEFREYCEKESYKKFFISTENQGFNDVLFYSAELVFNEIAIFLNPNTIYFKNKLDNLMISNVKRVELNSENSSKCKEFTVICGGKPIFNEEKKFVIFAQ